MYVHLLRDVSSLVHCLCETPLLCVLLVGAIATSMGLSTNYLKPIQTKLS